jgi:hypothetical protein
MAAPRSRAGSAAAAPERTDATEFLVRHTTIRRIVYADPSTDEIHRETIRVESPNLVAAAPSPARRHHQIRASLRTCRALLYESGATSYKPSPSVAGDTKGRKGFELGFRRCRMATSREALTLKTFAPFGSKKTKRVAAFDAPDAFEEAFRFVVAVLVVLVHSFVPTNGRMPARRTGRRGDVFDLVC